MFCSERRKMLMDDDAIIKLFLARNENALLYAKKEYEHYCLYIADNILHDEQDALECFNDALLAAWNSIPPCKPNSIKTYLCKLTRQISIDRMRKRNAEKRISSDMTISVDVVNELNGYENIDDSLNVKELSAKISLFLRSQKVEDRYVFIRRYWYGDSIEVICLKLGCRKEKVLVRLKRVRDRLAVYLKKEGYSI